MARVRGSAYPKSTICKKGYVTYVWGCPPASEILFAQLALKSLQNLNNNKRANVGEQVCEKKVVRNGIYPDLCTYVHAYVNIGSVNVYSI